MYYDLQHDLKTFDFYHINQVFETLVSELNSDDKGGFDRSLVLLILDEEFVTPGEDDEDYECDEDDEVRKIDRARNVRVIWYEIGTDEKASAEDIFTRLNIGKSLVFKRVKFRLSYCCQGKRTESAAARHCTSTEQDR